MSESREDLIAQRDALIEQLQGEWELDRSWMSVDRKLWRACLAWVISSAVCFYVPVAIILLLAPIEDEDPLFAHMMILLLGAGFGVAIATLLYAIVHGHQVMTRRCDHFRVSNHEFSRDCGKGYPTQRVSLDQLRCVDRPGQGGGYLNGSFMYEIMRAFGVRSFDQSAFHALISKGDHNTPGVRPMLVHRGERLVKLLTLLAAVNTKIADIEEAEAA